MIEHSLNWIELYPVTLKLSKFQWVSECLFQGLPKTSRFPRFPQDRVRPQRPERLALGRTFWWHSRDGFQLGNTAMNLALHWHSCLFRVCSELSWTSYQGQWAYCSVCIGILMKLDSNSRNNQIIFVHWNSETRIPKYPISIPHVYRWFCNFNMILDAASFFVELVAYHQDCPGQTETPRTASLTKRGSGLVLGSSRRSGDQGTCLHTGNLDERFWKLRLALWNFENIVRIWIIDKKRMEHPHLLPGARRNSGSCGVVTKWQFWYSPCSDSLACGSYQVLQVHASDVLSTMVHHGPPWSTNRGATALHLTSLNYSQVTDPNKLPLRKYDLLSSLDPLDIYIYIHTYIYILIMCWSMKNMFKRSRLIATAHPLLRCITLRSVILFTWSIKVRLPNSGSGAEALWNAVQDKSMSLYQQDLVANLHVSHVS